ECDETDDQVEPQFQNENVDKEHVDEEKTKQDQDPTHVTEEMHTLKMAVEAKEAKLSKQPGAKTMQLSNTHTGNHAYSKAEEKEPTTTEAVDPAVKPSLASKAAQCIIDRFTNFKVSATLTLSFRRSLDT
ncbi:hypothetical protein KEM55_008642, partial [Ascosphaera atra]